LGPPTHPPPPVILRWGNAPIEPPRRFAELGAEARFARFREARSGDAGQLDQEIRDAIGVLVHVEALFADGAGTLSHAQA
jgi:hypothetical protein